MELIKSYFGGQGNIYKQGKESIQYRVSSLQGLINAIIPHFDKYTLITQKQADYLLWRKIVILMQKKEHLTLEGIQKIVNLKASINKGLSDELKITFPKTIPMERPLVVDQVIKDPNWVAGFVSGEGCFLVNLYKVLSGASTRLGEGVALKLKVAQHLRDEELLKTLVSYLGCGVYSNVKEEEHGIFIVSSLSDILNILIPFFREHPIRGVKGEDFQDWCRVAKLMKDKKHLTLSGLEEIRKIKLGMNRGRK